MYKFREILALVPVIQDKVVISNTMFVRVVRTQLTLVCALMRVHTSNPHHTIGHSLLIGTL